MESFKVVRPEDLNHYGYLFGGALLQWVDETCWIAASREHPGCEFVTVAMDKVEFHRCVRAGTVLRFLAWESAVGSSSVKYEVKVFADDLETGEEESIFSTYVTFVRLGPDGKKTPLPGRRPA